MLSELSDSSLCSATRNSKLKVIYNGVNKMSSTNEVYLSRSLQSAMFPLLLYIWSIHYVDYVFIQYAWVYQVLYNNYLATDFTWRVSCDSWSAGDTIDELAISKKFVVFFRQRKR